MYLGRLWSSSFCEGGQNTVWVWGVSCSYVFCSYATMCLCVNQARQTCQCLLGHIWSYSMMVCVLGLRQADQRTILVLLVRYLHVPSSIIHHVISHPRTRCWFNVMLANMGPLSICCHTFAMQCFSLTVFSGWINDCEYESCWITQL